MGYIHIKGKAKEPEVSGHHRKRGAEVTAIAPGDILGSVQVTLNGKRMSRFIKWWIMEKLT